MTAEEAAQRLAVLSKSEAKVLLLLAQGKGTKQVAGELCRTESTVEAHALSMRRRLKVNTVQAIVLASKAGWV